MSKYGVFSGPYFAVFGLNTGKYEPEKTPYLDTFHAVVLWSRSLLLEKLHVLTPILLKKESTTDIFKERLQNFWTDYFSEHLRSASFPLPVL